MYVHNQLYQQKNEHLFILPFVYDATIAQLLNIIIIDSFPV